MCRRDLSAPRLPRHGPFPRQRSLGSICALGHTVDVSWQNVTIANSLLSSHREMARDQYSSKNRVNSDLSQSTAAPNVPLARPIVRDVPTRMQKTQILTAPIVCQWCKLEIAIGRPVNASAQIRNSPARHGIVPRSCSSDEDLHGRNPNGTNAYS